MKKLPFFIGLAMIAIQSIYVGIYLLSQVSISQSSLNMWGMLFMLIPTNITAFTLLIFGLVSDE
ncbi:unnamed protein product [marine sediment metagenome]|uniref:Uncharacterized protein n=1 Tax=marine sediment metagenome TaxID=412755 RepID=X1HNC8_9ZZZZ